MTTTHATILESIDVSADGILSVQLGKQTLIDGVIVGSEPHRVTFAPATDIDAVMNFDRINASLVSPLSDADRTAIKDKASAEWNLAVIDGYAAKIAAIESQKSITVVNQAHVKEEARRRILEKYPEWKQANLTARMVELNKIRADEGSWTDGEQIEVDAIQSAWDWVKSVRTASDALELTLPADYALNNDYWPAF
jgi:hypothetical protein